METDDGDARKPQPENIDGLVAPPPLNSDVTIETLRLLREGRYRLVDRHS